MQSRPDWAWEFCRGKTLLLERELAGPFLRVPIEAGNILGIELETRAEAAGRFPFSAFMGEHQLKDGTQGAGLAGQNGLLWMIERVFSSASDIGISSMASISDNNPIRNRSDCPWGTCGATNSAKRPRTKAERTRSLVRSWPAPTAATRRTRGASRVLPEWIERGAPNEYRCGIRRWRNSD